MAKAVLTAPAPKEPSPKICVDPVQGIVLTPPFVDQFKKQRPDLDLNFTTYVREGLAREVVDAVNALQEADEATGDRRIDRGERLLQLEAAQDRLNRAIIAYEEATADA